jgi:uncharacterized repeat protein (TIGR01451 family)
MAPIYPGNTAATSLATWDNNSPLTGSGHSVTAPGTNIEWKNGTYTFSANTLDFGPQPTDLKITASHGSTSASPGDALTYTVVATNSGPSEAVGAAIADAFPASLTGVTYTAVGSGGATGFTASGSGNISDTVTMPSGSTITYTVTGTVIATAFGTISDTATITAPSTITDTNPANNTATDTDNVLVILTTPALGSGDSVNVGQSYNIQWAGGTSATTLQLWADGPNGWAEIAPSVAATAGSYSWSTAGQAHGWYCFAAQVNPGSGGSWYTSDSPDFMHVVDPTSIAPTITITSPPASNVSVTQGGTCTITWTATDGSQAANTLHVSLWAYNVDTNGGNWFQVPGASWLNNTGSYAWNTTGYYHGWYCFSAHVWNGDAQGVDGSPGWLHLVEPAAQMPVFTFINPVPGKTITLGTIWDLKWTATIAPQDVGKVKAQLWVEYVDTADNNTPVWTELAASLNPTTDVYAWDTSGLNPAYQYYGFAAWVGYGDVWVSATDPNWIRVLS